MLTRKKVSFIVAGTQKAGTSALHRYLVYHPQLFLPHQKEIHFFDDENLAWSKGAKAREKLQEHYHAYFKDAPINCTWGEATPIYMYWWPSIGRIWEYNPEIKLIIVLRNPITRAFSHWNMQRIRGVERLGFLEALLQEEARCREACPQQHRLFSYASRGFYCEQLRRIWHFFPNDQTLVIKHDDLISQPAECLEQAYDHIGVEREPFLGAHLENALPYQSRIPKEADTFLREKFNAEIHQLEKMLGWDCSKWLKTQME